MPFSSVIALFSIEKKLDKHPRNVSNRIFLVIGDCIKYTISNMRTRFDVNDSNKCSV